MGLYSSSECESSDEVYGDHFICLEDQEDRSYKNDRNKCVSPATAMLLLKKIFRVPRLGRRSMSSWSKVGIVLLIFVLGPLIFLMVDDGLPYICEADPSIVIQKGGFSVNIAGDKKQMPYFYDSSDGGLDTVGYNVTSFVIVQHGWGYNGHDYACHMAKAIKNAFPDAADRQRIRMIAPQFYWLRTLFFDVTDAPGFNPNRDIYWENKNYQFGAESSSDAHFKQSISSFAVYDVLLASLCQNYNFPNLETVKLIGFSGGGQFVQRYSTWGAGYESLIQCAKSVEFFIGNPNVFAYFNASRPVLNVTETCSAYDFVCGEPEREVTFDIPPRDACPENYNAWGWGIEDINVPYMMAIDDLQKGINEFGTKKITYLAATDDMCNENVNYPYGVKIDYKCAVPSGKCLNTVLVSTKKESHCGELLQGFCRYQRIHIWYQFIKDYFQYEENFNHRFIKIPGVKHEPNKVFQSEEACCPLFGEEAQCCNATNYYDRR